MIGLNKKNTVFQDFCKLTLKLDSEKIELTNATITIDGGNKIIEKAVLKTSQTTSRRGTVKELWSQNDYTLNISGVLDSGDDYERPNNKILALRRFLEARQSIEVECAVLTPFNIEKIAIKAFNFPFTAGFRFQNYSISAVSDNFDADDLLKKID